MARAKIIKGEHYHIYNRGYRKQKTFIQGTDYARMLCNVLYFQSLMPIHNIREVVSKYGKNKRFRVTRRLINKIIDTRVVELEAFILMPNHFHLVVYEREENGISQYLQRVENGYTKYFNHKYRKNGYLFEGPYQSVQIESNEQALYLSAYIHRNIREVIIWRDREQLYPWSSYMDYVRKNRWGKLLCSEFIMDQFDTRKEYMEFVDTSGVKELDKDLLLD